MPEPQGLHTDVPFAARAMFCSPLCGSLRNCVFVPSKHLLRTPCPGRPFESLLRTRLAPRTPCRSSSEKFSWIFWRPNFGFFHGFAKGWFSKRVVLADVPPERMFPRNENRNEGTFACSPGTKNRNEGTFAKTTYETALVTRLVFPLDFFAPPSMRNL